MRAGVWIWVENSFLLSDTKEEVRRARARASAACHGSGYTGDGARARNLRGKEVGKVRLTPVILLARGGGSGATETTKRCRGRSSRASATVVEEARAAAPWSGSFWTKDGEEVMRVLSRG